MTNTAWMARNEKFNGSELRVEQNPSNKKENNNQYDDSSSTLIKS